MATTDQLDSDSFNQAAPTRSVASEDGAGHPAPDGVPNSGGPVSDGGASETYGHLTEHEGLRRRERSYEDFARNLTRGSLYDPVTGQVRPDPGYGKDRKATGADPKSLKRPEVAWWSFPSSLAPDADIPAPELGSADPESLIPIVPRLDDVLSALTEVATKGDVLSTLHKGANNGFGDSFYNALQWLSIGTVNDRAPRVHHPSGQPFRRGAEVLPPRLCDLVACVICSLRVLTVSGNPENWEWALRNVKRFERFSPVSYQAARAYVDRHLTALTAVEEQRWIRDTLPLSLDDALREMRNRGSLISRPTLGRRRKDFRCAS